MTPAAESEASEAGDINRGGDEATQREQAEKLEDGSLDPDEVNGEPEWWDTGADDET